MNREMEHTTSAKYNQGINAVKVYQDKQRNVSGWLIVTTSFMCSACFINFWIK